jgi:hypothetical protein
MGHKKNPLITPVSNKIPPRVNTTHTSKASATNNTIKTPIKQAIKLTNRMEKMNTLGAG